MYNWFGDSMGDFHFKKKYGQNFLRDVNIVKKIVKTANITGNDLVIEVGPGRGILTKELSKASLKVISYEIDSDLKNELLEVKNKYSNIDFVFEDFLKSNISTDIQNIKYEKLYFISNVPYYITTPILFKLIDSKLQFEKIIMMVQQEVGERFCAKPGTKNYSSLTVYLNYFYDSRIEFEVKREEFIPVPNVDSCIVSFTRKNNRFPLTDSKVFYSLIRDSFKYKRKNLKNNLKNYDLEKIDKVLKKNGYSLTSRAEELPLSVFVEISNELSL